jgi:hypothetical protein
MRIIVTVGTFSPCSGGVANVVGNHMERFIEAGRETAFLHATSR